MRKKEVRVTIYQITTSLDIEPPNLFKYIILHFIAVQFIASNYLRSINFFTAELLPERSL